MIKYLIAPLLLIAQSSFAQDTSRQEPVPPFPYYTEDVSFVNPVAHDTLAGTLTMPAKDGRYAVAVLLTGSGAQDRNSQIFNHQPFLVMADWLTRHGYAVLRYDDRGTAKSTGSFRNSTTADFADDAMAAVTYLKTRKEIDKKHIGLIGHSEGGEIAPMVAVKDPSIAFVVLLAGPGLRGDQLLLKQQALVGAAYGVPAATLEAGHKINAALFDRVINEPDSAKLRVQLQDYLHQAVLNKEVPGVPPGGNEQMFINTAIASVISPWMLYFIRYNPVPMLEKLKCPVLALNGDKDLQVPPKEDLEAIAAALRKGGNKQATIKLLPGLNHLFQECATGSPAEYAGIRQSFSPLALTAMTDWLDSLSLKSLK